MGELSSNRGRIAVLAPSPLLTVTIEAGDEKGPEVHFHGGGQGVWVARMAGLLGAEVILCVALAGESGEVLRALLPAERVEVRSVSAHGRSSSYVHDRRSGVREVIAATEGPRLWRHETDDLYGEMLTAALESDLAMLTGPQPPDAVSADVYRRLTTDLRANGKTVVADLTDGALEGALEGEVDLLKISDEELMREGLADGDDPDQLLAGVLRLREAGARNVLLSRATRPTYALVGERLYEVIAPRLESRDATGTGDSMFAALGVALAGGHSLIDAMKLGAAAGTLNATRSGLGTGNPLDIERMLDHVRVRELDGLEDAAVGATDIAAEPQP
jgi:Fructose-1-phosphate kinase and related fructose-6-phosphate kinase (PfkB)